MRAITTSRKKNIDELNQKTDLENSMKYKHEKDNYKKKHHKHHQKLDRNQCNELVRNAKESLEYYKIDEILNIELLLSTNMKNPPNQFIYDEIEYINKLENIYNKNQITINTINNSKSKNILFLKKEYIPILIETNRFILSFRNKILQLISSHINEVKDKINNHEFTPIILDSYPKMIGQLRCILLILKSKSDHNWIIFSNFLDTWTSYFDDELNSIYKNIGEIELSQVNEIKKLLNEIKNTIGSNYISAASRRGGSNFI